jgi:ATP-dependent DNA helicase DinG
MTLQDSVREAFGPDSQLSRRVREFRPRPGQVAMAQAIARTLEGGGVLVVEAGTGVGKTFAYLIPALLSGDRVILSTATKTLQDQLFGRDLPLLVDALGLAVRTALLKGRGSYVCLHRLALARQELPAVDRALAAGLASIETWSQVTQTGDLAELPGLDERSALIPLVTSTRDNCLGSQCPRHQACHVNLARREALAADVVVVNHHLFFADLAVRESGMAELLPSVKTVIFDEAHQLNEIGVQFLGLTLTTGQLVDLARDLLATGLTHARGLVDWNGVAATLEHAGRDLRMVIGKAPSGTKLRWAGFSPEGVHDASWSGALAALGTAIDVAIEALDTVSEIAPDFVRLADRAQAVNLKVRAFQQAGDPACVRWLDVGTQLRLVESPLDIADAVKTKLLKGHSANSDAGLDDEAQDSYSPRACIFTSASLGDNAQLTWFTEPCGLASAEILKVESPFDYPAQAAVYVPRHLPKPSDADHSVKVAALVAGAASVIGGRTLVLTTTLRALKVISDALRQALGEACTLEILSQGQLPKRELLQRFRMGSLGGRKGCILVASASFWEGVDVPGDALQMVVIDKLPFPPPNDPLVEARSARLQVLGRSPFKDYFLPEAAVALKQGAGRLIRRESDKGILVVCDSRLTVMGYGRRLMAALPQMRKLNSEEEFELALEALKLYQTRGGLITKTSTMDPICS